MSEKLAKSKEELVEDNILLLRKILQEAIDFYTKQRSDIQFERREGSGVLDDDELDRKERFVIERIAQYTDTKVALEQIIRSTAIEIPIDESLVEELITILVDKKQMAEYQANECTFVIRLFREQVAIREKLRIIFTKIHETIKRTVRNRTLGITNEMTVDGLERVIKSRKEIEHHQYRDFLLEQYQDWIEAAAIESDLPIDFFVEEIFLKLLDQLEAYQNEETRRKIIQKYFDSEKNKFFHSQEPDTINILDPDGPKPGEHVN